MMLCILLAPESRTFARADLLNASRSADIIELGLDWFIHKPDVAELIAGIEKPIIISCRRKKDGGEFEGTEEERLALLQEALTAGPAYLEIELDVAAKIPRTPGVKRLISVNRPFRALTEIATLQQQALNVGADVVKYTWPGLLLDSLEPVLKAMQQAHPPIVGIPLGHGGRMFGLMARRLGAPWVYAALEEGMEPHGGLPTVRQLTENYNLRGVDSQTKLIGVIGFGTVQQRTVSVFNSGFAGLGLNCRCLPLEIGSVAELPAMLDQLQFSAVVVTPGMGDYLLPLADQLEPAVKSGRHVDLLIRRKDGWHGFNVLWRSVLKVVERTLRRQPAPVLGLEATTNLILGANRITRTLLFGLKQLNGTAVISVPGNDDPVAFCEFCGEAQALQDAAATLAKETGVTSIGFSELTATLPHVLFVTDPALELGFTPNALNPLFLRPPLVVVDVTTMLNETDLLREARDRGCRVVQPRYILSEHISTQFKALTGQELPSEAFQLAIDLGE